MSQPWSFEQDLGDVFRRVGPVWETLRGAKLFITGSTGFIGCWLLESLRYADQKLNLGVQATILTRDPAAFRRKAPHLADDAAYTFLQGEVGSFESPQGDFTHVIHAATDASAHLNETNPLRMFDTIIEGTKRALDFAREKQARRVLFLSSGAVYGQQPWDIVNVPESYRGGPDPVDARAAYAEGKRAAEMLCAIYQKQFGLQIPIARIFALLGPYIALDIHFAAGNFIRNAMDGQPVIVKGNGKPCRSYLYASDLTVWLWHMLARAESCKPYNVGSDESVSVGELAQTIATTIGTGAFQILGVEDKGWNQGRYVPDTSLIAQDLGLQRTVSLEESIRRTALWNGWKGT